MDWHIVDTGAPSGKIQSSNQISLTKVEAETALEYLKAQKYTETVEHCKNAADAFDPQAMYFVGMANKLACDDKQFSDDFSYEKAATWLKTAHDRNFLPSTLELGNFLVKNKKYVEAVPYLEKIVELGSKEHSGVSGKQVVTANCCLGYIELFHLQPPKISEGKQRLLECISQSDPTAIFYMGRYHRDQGRVAGAASCYQMAISLGYNEAISELQNLLTEEANRHPVKIPMPQRTNAAEHQQAGECYRKIGFWAHAAKHYQLAAIWGSGSAQQALAELIHEEATKAQATPAAIVGPGPDH